MNLVLNHLWSVHIFVYKKFIACFQAGFAAAPTRAISSIKNMNIPQQIKVTDNINLIQVTWSIILLGHQVARPATGNQGSENVTPLSAHTVTHQKTPCAQSIERVLIMNLLWHLHDPYFPPVLLNVILNGFHAERIPLLKSWSEPCFYKEPLQIFSLEPGWCSWRISQPLPEDKN